MKLAQVNNPIAPNLSPESTGEAVRTFGEILTAVIRIFFIAGVLFFFFILLIGAIRWITSSGDPKAIESARGTIINAVVGLVIILSIFAILALINTFFSIDILHLDFGILKIGPGAKG